jgi:hypothetical protein
MASPDDVENWWTIIKSGGAAGAVIITLLGYIVNGERSKRKEQDERLDVLEDTAVKKPDLEAMEKRLTDALKVSTSFLNQRITDMRHKEN